MSSKEISVSLEDHIGVFDGVFDKDYCDSVIKKFESIAKLNNGLVARRTDDPELNPMNMDNSIYHPIQDESSYTLSTGLNFLQYFNNMLMSCYDVYAKKYGILKSMRRHHLDANVKIQKTSRSEGYHIWHCENQSIENGRRLLLVMLYLNDVESGGETEFLYQSKRVEPKMGRLVICPTSFTHTHRGNPPLTGDKYMLNGWVSFFE
tara:strand:- start:102 stop:719 length:618 start_codon:yes stop_codon:yes gene_type:complete